MKKIIPTLLLSSLTFLGCKDDSNDLDSKVSQSKPVIENVSKITREYSATKDDFRPAHHGIDYTIGTRGVEDTFYLPMEGIVKKIGYNNFHGNFVEIEHDAHSAFYAHIRKPTFKVGQKVGYKDYLVESNSGSVTGISVHLTTKDSTGRHVNPRLVYDFKDSSNILK